jgi:hypothetical protein
MPRNNSDWPDLIPSFADYIAPSPAEPAPLAIHSIANGRGRSAEPAASVLGSACCGEHQETLAFVHHDQPKAPSTAWPARVGPIANH